MQRQFWARLFILTTPFAGTMGRCMSGPQGIAGTNCATIVTTILIEFCDSDEAAGTKN